MKKTVYLFLAITIGICVSIFLYNRYKSQRIDSMIGLNQMQLEQQIRYPGSIIELEEVNFNQVDEEVAKIIRGKGLSSETIILKYTMYGQVRKHVYWLVDEGKGYVVIEAIDTNL